MNRQDMLLKAREEAREKARQRANRDILNQMDAKEERWDRFNTVKTYNTIAEAGFIVSPCIPVEEVTDDFATQQQRKAQYHSARQGLVMIYATHADTGDYLYTVGVNTNVDPSVDNIIEGFTRQMGVHQKKEAAAQAYKDLILSYDLPRTDGPWAVSEPSQDYVYVTHADHKFRGAIGLQGIEGGRAGLDLRIEGKKADILRRAREAAEAEMAEVARLSFLNDTPITWERRDWKGYPFYQVSLRGARDFAFKEKAWLAITNRAEFAKAVLGGKYRFFGHARPSAAIKKEVQSFLPTPMLAARSTDEWNDWLDASGYVYKDGIHLINTDMGEFIFTLQAGRCVEQARKASTRSCGSGIWYSGKIISRNTGSEVILPYTRASDGKHVNGYTRRHAGQEDFRTRTKDEEIAWSRKELTNESA